MVLTLAAALVPQPASLAVGPGSVTISALSRIVVQGEADAAASALSHVITEQTGLRLGITADAPRAGDLVVHRTDRDDEAYELHAGDRVEITGGPAGLFYGVQTLRQLLHATGETATVPECDIRDEPRFAHRGVMLDVARTFFPVADVKAFIDRAAALKFNRLHLHLSDDQGWRIRIDSRPLLTERAAGTSALGRPGGFYSKDDYREIVRHAADRHMVVVPEIDLPGHTHAIGLAYPEIMAEPQLTDQLIADAERLGQPLPVAGEPYLGWAVGHSSLRIHEAATYEFVRDVLTELAELTPGPYLHIGGDEALGTPQADFDRFIERVTALVTELGKTPIAWHEAGSAEVARGTIGQFWGSVTPTAEHAREAQRFVERGGGLILSPSDVAYLDQKYDAEFPLGLDWAGLIDVATAYDWDPSQVLPDVRADAILGVEAPLWSETVESLADVDQLFFPRAAAIAEIAWSPADGRDLASFRERLGGLGGVWDAAGWGGHRPDDVPWRSR